MSDNRPERKGSLLFQRSEVRLLRGFLIFAGEPCHLSPLIKGEIDGGFGSHSFQKVSSLPLPQARLNLSLLAASRFCSIFFRPPEDWKHD